MSSRFVAQFLEKVEFDENKLASKFFPLTDSKNVVVDPKHQFGQPVVAGTNTKTTTLYNLFKAGESVDFIAGLYDLSVEQVKDAIRFYQMAA